MRAVLWQTVLVALGVGYMIAGEAVQGAVFLASSMVVAGLARFE